MKNLRQLLQDAAADEIPAVLELDFDSKRAREIMGDYTSSGGGPFVVEGALCKLVASDCDESPDVIRFLLDVLSIN